MFRYISITILMLNTWGCTKTYKLNADDLQWNPYKGGEVLIFKSNQGGVDTVFVKSVQREKTVDDNLSLAPNYHESLDVIVKHSDPTPPNSQRYLEGSFFEIFASKNDNTLIKFYFAAKGAWFYEDSYLKKELNRLPVQELMNKNLLYKDIIKIEPKNKKYYERDEFVIALYWSKKKGYVRYDLKNGEYWELQ